MIVAFALLLAVGRPRDPWFGADKLKHFFTAAVVQSLSYGATRATGVEHRTALRTAWAATAALSVAKEIRDRRVTGLFSLRDLAWDAAGAAVATAMLNHGRRDADASASTRLIPALPPASHILLVQPTIR